MPPTTDPQHLALLLWIGLPLLGVLLAVLGWSLRSQLAAIATDVRQLASSVGSHESRLAAGAEKFLQIERRLDKLEEHDSRFSPWNGEGR